MGRLGEGGQGVVYLGVGGTGERVAVKVFHASVRAGRDSGIVRELAAARQVAEFCTVRILEIGLEGRPPYIASEYVDGPTLQHVIEREGPRRGAGLHRLAIGTITALAAIHRAGVVHRDFKPGNVLIGADGPRVIDFGIARLAEASHTTGGASGSPSYMAPEHFSGERIGPKADVFAWGSTIAYAATGVPPFGGDTLAAIAYRILHNEPDLSALPVALRSVVAPCLAKDPERRPSAKDVLLRLLDDREESTEETVALRQGAVVAGGPPGGVAGRAAGEAAGRGAGGAAVVNGRPRGGPDSPSGETPTGPAGAGVSRRRLLLSVASGVVAVGGGGAVLAYAASRNGGTPGAASGTPSARRSTKSSPAPPEEETEPPPGNAIDLAAAIDTAVTARPVADFTFTGAFTESSSSARATGRLVHGNEGSSRTDYDMRLQGGGIEAGERVVVLGTSGYAVNRTKKAFELYRSPEDGERPGYADGAAMVVATGSVLTLLEIIAVSRSVRRDGRTYSASISMSAAGADLHQLFTPWNQAVDKTYVSYTVTIDPADLPVEFRLIWKVPIAGTGFYESSFTTRYASWRQGSPIHEPK
ncbi:serine/threonine-protein kinase [Sphaerisporangium aureirubrum]|uniref:Serine/threonine-protein kinase n=1 Tax=Sphaerisporangium aureirubrum TaxID=1544736 RepID=A0ABW1NF26_9ACTN